MSKRNAESFVVGSGNHWETTSSVMSSQGTSPGSMNTTLNWNCRVVSGNRRENHARRKHDGVVRTSKPWWLFFSISEGLCTRNTFPRVRQLTKSIMWRFWSAYENAFAMRGWKCSKKTLESCIMKTRRSMFRSLIAYFWAEMRLLSPTTLYTHQIWLPTTFSCFPKWKKSSGGGSIWTLLPGIKLRLHLN